MFEGKRHTYNARYSLTSLDTEISVLAELNVKSYGGKSEALQRGQI